MTDKGRSLGLGGDSRPRGHEFDSSFWILDKKIVPHSKRPRVSHF